MLQELMGAANDAYTKERAPRQGVYSTLNVVPHVSKFDVLVARNENSILSTISQSALRVKGPYGE
jgi:hypothetical protein